MKSIKWSAIIIALIYIASGVYFFLYPNTSEDFICTLLGGALIGIGLFNVVAYLIKPQEESFFRDDFKNALILITVGCFAIAYKPLFTELVYAFIGIIIMNSGFGKLQDCVDTWRFGSNHGPLYIIMAIVSIATGLVAAINPFVNTTQLHYLIGGGLVFSGVSDFFSSIYLSVKMAGMKKEKAREEEEARLAEEALNQQIEKELDDMNSDNTDTPVVPESVIEVTETVEETVNTETKEQEN